MIKFIGSRRFYLFAFLICASVLGIPSRDAVSLDLDWSGQFRTESHIIYNYTLDGTGGGTDATRAAAGGYYVPGGGEKNAFFQTAFMRLRPSVIVNDNIYLKSEWWVGSPVYGLFGNGAPSAIDQRQFYSNQNRGSTITAQRFWAEILTDIGTVEVGRAPLNWGLGLVWNAGDSVYSRYSSTGDVIRIVSKFGAFSFTPSVIKYSAGNNLGGSCQNPTGAFVGTPGDCAGTVGSDDVTEYSFQFKYENLDEDLELGLNFIRRLGGAAQDNTGNAGYIGIDSANGRLSSSMVYNIWDIFARKRLGPITLAAEVPITSGAVSGIPYTSFGLAVEGKWDVTDRIETTVKAGWAPGQPSGTADKFSAFYFNPNYKLGLIMFNYQFANFAGPNTLNNPGTTDASLRSPFDNPIVNAQYLSLNGAYKLNKWKFYSTWIFATAPEVSTTGTSFFNYWDRKFYTNSSGVSQTASLGWEMDYGTTFYWDEAFQFDFAFGWFFPGSYYDFTNTGGTNGTVPAFATNFSVGINF